MRDIETRLRDAMELAAPEAPSTEGLAAGAHRYAARARRVRAATTAMLAAVVVGVVGVAASGGFGDRAAEPAQPDPPTPVHDLCPMLQRGITSLDAPPAQPASATQQAVLVCALTGADSVWPGALPPDEAVNAAAALDLLRWELRTPSQPDCGSWPRGPAFTVSIRDHRGQDRTFLNTDLACDGWPFLSSYYVALSELGADWGTANEAKDPYPGCPSILHEQGRRSEGSPAELPKGTVVTSASLCAHPNSSPVVAGDRSVPRPVQVRRSALGERELARLNADLARTGAVRGAASCRETAPLDVTYVVRAVTSTGSDLTLTAHSACLPSFAVNNDTMLTITLDAATVEAVVGSQQRYP